MANDTTQPSETDRRREVLARVRACTVACTWLWSGACANPPSEVRPDATSSTSLVMGSSTSSTASDTSDDPTAVIFLMVPDGGSSHECETFVQDCPPGEKCTIWADDGGSTWNATKCVPVVDDPAGPGEPCLVEISGVSGLDDCERGAVCWDVHPKTLEGICIAFCTGDESTLHCEDPSIDCSISSDLAVCVPSCNPLEWSCPAGRGCYPYADAWRCTIDASGGMGAPGDPCMRDTACDPGLVCMDASTVPPGRPCEGTSGCCTELCDLSDPLGDLQCAGAPEGQLCQAWYQDGEAPVGLENVGVCALPQ